MCLKCDQEMTGKTNLDLGLHRNHRINFSRWRSHFSQYYVLLCILMIFDNLLFVNCNSSVYTAKVNITYYEDDPNKAETKVLDMGQFGQDVIKAEDRRQKEAGRLVHVLTTENKTDACRPIVNAPPKTHWVALVERGVCNLSEKVDICGAANASAVIIYNNADPNSWDSRSSYNLKGKVSAIFVTKADGQKLLSYMNSYSVVNVQILEGHERQTICIMLRAKRKSTSPYVRPSRALGTRPTSSNVTVTIPSVPAASSVSVTQTGPTSVASGSRHAVAFGSAPSFDPQPM